MDPKEFSSLVYEGWGFQEKPAFKRDSREAAEVSGVSVSHWLKHFYRIAASGSVKQMTPSVVSLTPESE